MNSSTLGRCVIVSAGEGTGRGRGRDNDLARRRLVRSVGVLAAGLLSDLLQSDLIELVLAGKAVGSPTATVMDRTPRSCRDRGGAIRRNSGSRCRCRRSTIVIFGRTLLIDFLRHDLRIRPSRVGLGWDVLRLLVEHRQSQTDGVPRPPDPAIPTCNT